MSESFKITIAQLNMTLGDLSGNKTRIEDAYAKAIADGSDLLVCTEFSISGYPPEDLVRKPAFIRESFAAIEALAAITAEQDTAIIVGGPRAHAGLVHNALYFLAKGKIVETREKYHLPNYGVFDEKRVFDQGQLREPIEYKGLRLGLCICEDIWFSDVPKHLKSKGADIIIAPHGSPFEYGKADERLTIAVMRAKEIGLPIIVANQIGGQDELVFDGASFALNGDCTLAAQLKSFEEDIVTVSCAHTEGGLIFNKAVLTPALEEDEALYTALLLGLRDYVNKNGFPGVLIGMSGGVDSALTAALAVDAFGADKVDLVMMPSRYTSEASLTDAKACANALGATYETIAIEPMIDAFTAGLSKQFSNTTPDTTEENLQARIRGSLLMALSNKFGKMVVATGNKSEMSVGYSTLYGDLCGGFALLKDLYKTKVYDLCRWRNKNQSPLGLGPAGEVIPLNIITKAPTAELRDNQTDQDSLPAYEDLDAILSGLVENDCSISDLVEDGFDASVVAQVEHLLYIAEYKRRQAPPGVKLTPKHLGRDRRYPITNRFRNRLTETEEQK